MAHIVPAYIVMAYIVLVLYSYGPYSSGLCRYGLIYSSGTACLCASARACEGRGGERGDVLGAWGWRAADVWRKVCGGGAGGARRAGAMRGGRAENVRRRPEDRYNN